MKVSSLHTYPIKAARGLNYDTMAIDKRGPVGDRRWVIVDNENYFITQRDFPVLATLGVEHDENGLRLTRDDNILEIDLPSGAERANVMVWRDVIHAAIANQVVNDALSAMLGKKVKLAYMDDTAKRLAGQEFAKPEDEVSFADSFPFLVTSERSLNVLNDYIVETGGEAVPMNRFRPNIAVDGFDPWDEDTWLVVQIGDLIFDAVCPCTRCAVTTKDQKTGEGSADNQPVRALTQIRRSADRRTAGVLFGWNLIPRKTGSLSIGDQVVILERRDRWPIAI